MAYGDLKSLYTQLGARRGFDGNASRLTQFINQAVQTIWSYRPDWAWARRQYQVNAIAPESGAVATFTAGSRTVAAMTPVSVLGTHTRTEGLLSTPEGTVYRLAGASTSAVTVNLPVGYTGPTTAGNGAWTIYYDTYPLPPESVLVESIVATGGGWEYPLKQSSILPQHMQALSRRGYESYPTHYSLDQSGSLPVANGAASAAASGTGLTGVYTYWYAYENITTKEIGPLSPPVKITLTNQGAILTNVTAYQDYHRVIFRSVAGGSQPLLVGRLSSVASTTFPTAGADTTTDTLLGRDTDGVYYGAHRGSYHTRVRFWPPPDDDYLLSVTYFAAAMVLERDHDVPDIPRRFIPLILDMAESYFLREQEAHGAANQREQAVMAKLERISAEQDADPATEVAVGRGSSSADAAFTRGGVWPRLFNQ
jgi:hypothetical protein